MSLENNIPHTEHRNLQAAMPPPSNCPPSSKAGLDPKTGTGIKQIAQDISQHYPAYGTCLKRSLFQVITTGAAFFAMLALMSVFAERMYWLTLLLSVPTAGLLVRLFIVQHDCGHGSYFKSQMANNLTGRLISVLTFTPYDHWRRSHAGHHATSGNLDRRGQGDVMTMTVEEYQKMSPLKQLGYRLYRNPFIMILIGAPVNFVILQRVPLGRGARDRGALRSVLALNLALVVAYGSAMAIFGIGPVIAIYLPVITIAAWIGGWLFYVQHQFEGAFWKRNDEWDFHSASIIGSSYFELPLILRWFTGSIGLHHIHHLCCRIPNYRLQNVQNAFPQLSKMAKRINLRESMDCSRLALWDERKARMIGFSDLKG